MTDLSIVAIIPLYNGAKWIEQSIRSVLAQTLQPDEFIVVDDGSTDNGAGAAIVKRLAQEHPITLLHKPNGGQSSARNFAVRHSTSPLIALLDQDDTWYPHHLEELTKPFRKRRGIPLGWVYSNLDEIDESGGMVHRRFLDVVPLLIGKPLEFPRRNLVTCLDRDMFILPSASLISREAFDAIGGFDERLSGYEDDDLFLRLFRAGYDNIFLNRSLSKWRIFPGSTSYTYRMAKSRIIYAQKLFEMFPDNPQMARYFAHDCIAPRFYANVLTDLKTSMEQGDKAMFNAAMSHLQILHPHLRIRHRIRLALRLSLLGHFQIARVAYRIRHPLRPMARIAEPRPSPEGQITDYASLHRW
jgi:glycosyltransferase involved in cell wall biosynthesis